MAAAEAAQEALDLAVAAVDGLGVQRAPDPLSGRGVDALVSVSRRKIVTPKNHVISMG